MIKSQIDPAALLLAVIAVGLALTVSPGPFGLLSTIAGLTLLIILFAYDQQGYRSGSQSLAFAAACAFCIMLAAGMGLQILLGTTKLEMPLAMLWLVATVIGIAVDRARMASRLSAVQEPVQPQAPLGSSWLGQPQPVYQPPPFQTPEPVRQPAPARQPEPAWQPPPAPAPVQEAVTETVPAFQPADAPTQPAYAPPFAATPEAPPPPVAPPPPNAYQAPEATIYVALIGEGISSLRSVKAEHLGRDIYRIIESMPENESWRYQPGQIVRCKKQKLSSGKAMVAIEEVALQRM